MDYRHALVSSAPFPPPASPRILNGRIVDGLCHRRDQSGKMKQWVLVRALLRPGMHSQAIAARVFQSESDGTCVFCQACSRVQRALDSIEMENIEERESRYSGVDNGEGIGPSSRNTPWRKSTRKSSSLDPLPTSKNESGSLSMNKLY